MKVACRKTSTPYINDNINIKAIKNIRYNKMYLVTPFTISIEKFGNNHSERFSIKIT